MSQSDTEYKTRVSIDGVRASLTGEALTFNADTPDEELATDAIYVMLTPSQADDLSSWFASHGGEEVIETRAKSDLTKPSSFMTALHQGGIATDAATAIAENLPDDDPRQQKAEQAADLLGEVSESLSAEWNDAIDDE